MDNAGLVACLRDRDYQKALQQAGAEAQDRLYRPVAHRTTLPQLLSQLESAHVAIRDVGGKAALSVPHGSPFLTDAPTRHAIETCTPELDFVATHKGKLPSCDACSQPMHIVVFPRAALCLDHATGATAPVEHVDPLPWWELNCMAERFAIANSMADVLGIARLPDELVTGRKAVRL